LKIGKAVGSPTAFSMKNLPVSSNETVQCRRKPDPQRAQALPT
jgi:hypothetical protein